MVSAIAGAPVVLASLLLMSSPLTLRSVLLIVFSPALASFFVVDDPDVLVVSCAVVYYVVANVLTADGVPEVPLLLLPLLLMTSLLRLVFPTFLAALLLLASLLLAPLLLLTSLLFVVSALAGVPALSGVPAVASVFAGAGASAVDIVPA